MFDPPRCDAPGGSDFGHICMFVYLYIYIYGFILGQVGEGGGLVKYNKNEKIKYPNFFDFQYFFIFSTAKWLSRRDLFKSEEFLCFWIFQNFRNRGRVKENWPQNDQNHEKNEKKFFRSNMKKKSFRFFSKNSTAMCSLWS